MKGFAFCNELYGNLPLEQQLAMIAAAGYQGVELDARCLAGRAPSVIATQCRERGLAVVGLHWLLAGTQGLHLTHPSRQVRQATLDHLKKLVAGCAELGGEVMVLGGGKTRRVLEGIGHAEALGHAEELLKALGEELVARGVKIGLEPLAPTADNLLNRAEDAAQLVDRVGCPNIGLTLDARAMESEDRPREELITTYAPYLVHIHVSDASGAGPGMGETDLGPMLQALNTVSYRGWVSVEAFDPSPAPDTIAKRSLEYLTQLWLTTASPGTTLRPTSGLHPKEA